MRVTRALRSSEARPTTTKLRHSTQRVGQDVFQQSTCAEKRIFVPRMVKRPTDQVMLQSTASAPLFGEPLCSNDWKRNASRNAITSKAWKRKMRGGKCRVGSASQCSRTLDLRRSRKCFEPSLRLYLNRSRWSLFCSAKLSALRFGFENYLSLRFQEWINTKQREALNHGPGPLYAFAYYRSVAIPLRFIAVASSSLTSCRSRDGKVAPNRNNPGCTGYKSSLSNSV